MNNIKDFSTKWLREEVRLARACSAGAEKTALMILINSIESYIEHISRNAYRKGRGTSDRKAKSSAANGRLGGRPKKKKDA